MTPLQQAILASLPRVDADGYGNYMSAYGLCLDPDAHPLIAQAELNTIRGALGHLTKQNVVISAAWDSNGRGPRLYAVYASPPTITG